MRTTVALLTLTALGCRGPDVCAGDGTAWLELGDPVQDEFAALSDGDTVPLAESSEGTPGVELGIRTRGVNTRDAVTVTLELEMAGYLKQLVADTDMVCDGDGLGRVRVFAAVPQAVQQEPQAHDGGELYLQATVIDARDRVVHGDPLVLSLSTQ